MFRLRLKHFSCLCKNITVECTQDGANCVTVTGGAGSTVGSEGIEILDCDLDAQGVGTFHVNASAMNRLYVRGGNWRDSSSSAIFRADQVADLEIRDVTGVGDLLLTFDSGGTLPSLAGSVYRVQNVRGGNVTTTLTGAGSLTIGASTLGDHNLNGDRSVRIVGSDIGTIAVNDTVACTLVDGSHGAVSGSPTATLVEPVQRGSISFAASAAEVVTFDVPQPDTDYTLSLDTDLVPAAFTDIPRMTTQGVSSFTVGFGAAVSTTVRYALIRRVP